MKYEEFDKLVEQPNLEEKQALFNSIIEGLPYPAEIWNTESPSAATATEKQVVKPAVQRHAGKRRTAFRSFFKKPARMAACISMAAATACLAIALPFALKSGGAPSDVPTQAQKERYCYAASCKEKTLSYTLKEYSELNNLSLLYVDWYDEAEIKTSLHVNKEDSTDIIYYEEMLRHKYTGSIVEIFISDIHTLVDRFEEYVKACNKHIEKRVYATRVDCHWGFETLEDGEPYLYKAMFAFEGRRYFIELRYPMGENMIFKVIDSILATKKR